MFRRFIWEMIPGSRSKGGCRVRQGGRKASKSFTTDFGYHCGQQEFDPTVDSEKIADCFRISHRKSGRLEYLLLIH